MRFVWLGNKEGRDLNKATVVYLLSWVEVILIGVKEAKCSARPLRSPCFPGIF